MSQIRVFVRELRAVFSAATICALILGLVFSNVAQAAGGLTPPSNARTGAYALCVQHLTHHNGSERRYAPSGDERSGQHKCPSCCLAATLGAALLPERVTNTTTPPANRPVLVAYFAASPSEPKNLLFGAANGARAPPA